MILNFDPKLIKSTVSGLILCTKFLFLKKLKHIIITQNCFIGLWTPKGWHFIKKINVIGHKMLNLCFKTSDPFLRSTFLFAAFFLYLWSVWVDVSIINIWRLRGKSISRAFCKVKNLVVCAKFPVVSKFHFSK